MLSERSPGSVDASRSIPMAQPIFVVAIGVLRLVGRRGDLLAQDDKAEEKPSLTLPRNIGV